jgi:hypothetical protein
MIRRHLVCTVFCLAAGAAQAAPIASSIADFSNVQGQDGWSYGFFNQGVDGTTPYTTGAFKKFETFGIVGPGVWGATDLQVGSQNNVYLGLGAATGHPTGLAPPDQQDRIIWAVRRYESEVAGDVDISIVLRKDNTNPNGGGITGRVFVNGAEIYTQFVAATDGTGFQKTFVRNVGVGDLIEFAIDPLGVIPVDSNGRPIGGDGIYSPRADGTIFSAVISPHVAAAPIAPTSLLMVGGLMGLVATRRYRRA